MQCNQDVIQVGDVMVLANGREISMLKTSVEQSPDQQLAAACIVHGNVIVPLCVKKGLDKLYHKMEKDMSDASQLEVTWGIMQKAFIEQFKEFEDLIEKCYPGSSITLEFTIEDLTNYISQAKSTQQ
ncbi:hypothetical protein EMCRGX_G014432 [Ephydatia muelleri]